MFADSRSVSAEHFSCAYSNKILRQGHMYVMLRHVCFNSSVFSTPVKIHAADIKSVLPKSNLFLPNSIEIIEVCPNMCVGV